MKLSIKAGKTSKILQIFIQDSSSTTGAGLTGLAYNSSGLTAYYHREGDTTATAITLATMTVGTFTSGGFEEIDATNMPGWYQFCPPDAALATGSESVGLHLKGATNMAPLPIEVELVAYDPQDAVRLGLTALPNAAAGANGGLPTGDASGKVALQADQAVNVTKVNGTAQTAEDIGAAVATILTDVNTGAGAIYTRLGAPSGASLAADIAAVKSDTGSTLTDAAAIKTTTDKFAFTVANQVDANAVSVGGDGTGAANLAKTTRAIARGTVGAAASTTSIPTSAFSPAGSASGQFIGRTVLFDADTATAALRGQATNITGSTASATPTLTVTALTTAPASGDTFSVI